MFIYKHFPLAGCYTVGHYDQGDGAFIPESDHASAELAAKRVRTLNGGQPEPAALTVHVAFPSEVDGADIRVEVLSNGWMYLIDCGGRFQYRLMLRPVDANNLGRNLARASTIAEGLRRRSVQIERGV